MLSQLEEMKPMLSASSTINNKLLSEMRLFMSQFDQKDIMGKYKSGLLHPSTLRWTANALAFNKFLMAMVSIVNLAGHIRRRFDEVSGRRRQGVEPNPRSNWAEEATGLQVDADGNLTADEMSKLIEEAGNLTRTNAQFVTELAPACLGQLNLDELVKTAQSLRSETTQIARASADPSQKVASRVPWELDVRDKSTTVEQVLNAVQEQFAIYALSTMQTTIVARAGFLETAARSTIDHVPLDTKTIALRMKEIVRGKKMPIAGAPVSGELKVLYPAMGLLHIKTRELLGLVIRCVDLHVGQNMAKYALECLQNIAFVTPLAIEHPNHVFGLLQKRSHNLQQTIAAVLANITADPGRECGELNMKDLSTIFPLITGQDAVLRRRLIAALSNFAMHTEIAETTIKSNILKLFTALPNRAYYYDHFPTILEMSRFLANISCHDHIAESLHTEEIVCYLHDAIKCAYEQVTGQSNIAHRNKPPVQDGEEEDELIVEPRDDCFYIHDISELQPNGKLGMHIVWEDAKSGRPKVMNIYQDKDRLGPADMQRCEDKVGIGDVFWQISKPGSDKMFDVAEMEVGDVQHLCKPLPENFPLTIRFAKVFSKLEQKRAENFQKEFESQPRYRDPVTEAESIQEVIVADIHNSCEHSSERHYECLHLLLVAAHNIATNFNSHELFLRHQGFIPFYMKMVGDKDCPSNFRRFVFSVLTSLCCQKAVGKRIFDAMSKSFVNLSTNRDTSQSRKIFDAVSKSFVDDVSHDDSIQRYVLLAANLYYLGTSTDLLSADQDTFLFVSKLAEIDDSYATRSTLVDILHRMAQTPPHVRKSFVSRNVVVVLKGFLELHEFWDVQVKAFEACYWMSMEGVIDVDLWEAQAVVPAMIQAAAKPRPELDNADGSMSDKQQALWDCVIRTCSLIYPIDVLKEQLFPMDDLHHFLASVVGKASMQGNLLYASCKLMSSLLSTKIAAQFWMKWHSVKMMDNLELEVARSCVGDTSRVPSSQDITSWREALSSEDGVYEGIPEFDDKAGFDYNIPKEIQYVEGDEVEIDYVEPPTDPDTAPLKAKGQKQLAIEKQLKEDQTFEIDLSYPPPPSDATDSLLSILVFIAEHDRFLHDKMVRRAFVHFYILRMRQYYILFTQLPDPETVRNSDKREEIRQRKNRILNSFSMISRLINTLSTSLHGLQQLNHNYVIPVLVPLLKIPELSQGVWLLLGSLSALRESCVALIKSHVFRDEVVRCCNRLTANPPELSIDDAECIAICFDHMASHGQLVPGLTRFFIWSFVQLALADTCISAQVLALRCLNRIVAASPKVARKFAGHDKVLLYFLMALNNCLSTESVEDNQETMNQNLEDQDPHNNDPLSQVAVARRKALASVYENLPHNSDQVDLLKHYARGLFNELVLHSNQVRVVVFQHFDTECYWRELTNLAKAASDQKMQAGSFPLVYDSEFYNHVITKLHVTQQIIFARQNIDGNGVVQPDPTYVEFENANNIVKMLEALYGAIFAQDEASVEGRIAGAIAEDATMNVLLTQIMVDMCSKPFTSGYLGAVRHEFFYNTLLSVARNSSRIIKVANATKDDPWLIPRKTDKVLAALMGALSVSMVKSPWQRDKNKFVPSTVMDNVFLCMRYYLLQSGRPNNENEVKKQELMKDDIILRYPALMNYLERGMELGGAGDTWRFEAQSKLELHSVYAKRMLDEAVEHTKSAAVSDEAMRYLGTVASFYVMYPMDNNLNFDLVDHFSLQNTSLLRMLASVLQHGSSSNQALACITVSNMINYQRDQLNNSELTEEFANEMFNVLKSLFALLRDAPLLEQQFRPSAVLHALRAVSNLLMVQDENLVQKIIRSDLVLIMPSLFDCIFGKHATVPEVAEFCNLLHCFVIVLRNFVTISAQADKQRAADVAQMALPITLKIVMDSITTMEDYHGEGISEYRKRLKPDMYKSFILVVRTLLSSHAKAKRPVTWDKILQPSGKVSKFQLETLVLDIHEHQQRTTKKILSEDLIEVLYLLIKTGFPLGRDSLISLLKCVAYSKKDVVIPEGFDRDEMQLPPRCSEIATVCCSILVSAPQAGQSKPQLNELINNCANFVKSLDDESLDRRQLVWHFRAASQMSNNPKVQRAIINDNDAYLFVIRLLNCPKIPELR
eukprot:gene934-471_t